MTELTDFSLKLKACESLCHFPETDVATTTSEQDVVCERRKCDLVNFLGEGLCFKNDSLVYPVPNGDRVVRVTSDTGKFGSRDRELNMGVEVLRSIFHNSVELEARVFIDIYVWEPAFLSYSEVFLRGMHCNRTNAIAVLANKDPLFMGFDVVDLVSVTSREDDDRLS